MSQAQIEDFVFQDIIGHRKTQKFGSMDNFFHDLWNNSIEYDLLHLSTFQKTLTQHNYDFPEQQISALKKMYLKPILN